MSAHTRSLYDWIAALPEGEWTLIAEEDGRSARTQQQNLAHAMRRRGIRIQTQRTGANLRVRVLGRDT